jgi:GH25 family lysozyme M1 (1,4-beta-N-acetylmuramidase)
MIETKMDKIVIKLKAHLEWEIIVYSYTEFCNENLIPYILF